MLTTDVFFALVMFVGQVVILCHTIFVKVRVRRFRSHMLIYRLTLLKIGVNEIGPAYRNFSRRFEESYSRTFDLSEKFAFWDLFFGIGVM